MTSTSMRFRKLRIAWSAVWCIVGAILCALCVHSYWQTDSYPKIWNGHNFALRSGKLLIDEYFYFAPQAAADANYELGDGSGRWGVTKTVRVTSSRHAISLAPVTACIFLVATTPWLSLKRFSLRTLLLATTLIAALLGLTVWLLNR
jgi:hypothetical protein